MFERGTLNELHQYCQKAYSWANDQGSVVDSPLAAESAGLEWAGCMASVRDGSSFANDAASAERYMFPNAISFNDSLHRFLQRPREVSGSAGTFDLARRRLPEGGGASWAQGHDGQVRRGLLGPRHCVGRALFAR